MLDRELANFERAKDFSEFYSVLKVRNDYLRALMSVVIYTNNILSVLSKKILLLSYKLAMTHHLPVFSTVWGESSF